MSFVFNPFTGNLDEITDEFVIKKLTTAQIAALPFTKANLVYDTDLEKTFINQDSGRWAPIATVGYKADTSLTADSTLFLDSYNMIQTILVAGASGPIRLDPTATFGQVTLKTDGETVTLIGNSDANSVTIPAPDTANNVLGYEVTLGRGQTATYRWVASLSRWIIISTSN